MLLTPDVLEIVALAAAGVAVLALLVAVMALLALGRLRRSSELLAGGDDGTGFIEAVNRKAAEVERLRDEVGEAATLVSVLREDLRGAIRHVAVVRYDAFQDMGGRMSYSAALLDDSGDGMVITAINGRQETRTYAKGITGGTSETALSPEETEAIGIAVGGRALRPVRAGEPDTRAGRRRAKHAG